MLRFWPTFTIFGQIYIVRLAPSEKFGPIVGPNNNNWPKFFRIFYIYIYNLANF